MSINVPRLVDWRRQAQNGDSPAVNFYRDLDAAVDHLGRYGSMRQLYGRARELGILSGASASTTVARWRIRTGPYADRLAVVLLLGEAFENGASAAQPYAEVDLKISGGATTTLGPFVAPITAFTGVGDAPNDCLVAMATSDVNASTVYECALRQVEYCRVVAVLVFEQGSATAITTLPDVVAGSPIYDAHRNALLPPLSNMHAECGGISWHWSLFDGSSRTRTSSTAINLIDNTTTGTPTTAHYGVYLTPAYHNRASKTTVAFSLGAYASISGGATGTVRLIDTSGNTYSLSITGASLAWNAGTVNLPATEAFYALQFLSDGTQTLTVNAVSLIELG